MKIQETRIIEGEGGIMLRVRETRVRELAEGETIPDGATAVADDAEVHDWEAGR